MKRLGTKRRRRVEGEDPAAWIGVSAAHAGQLPTVIEPRASGVDLAAWAQRDIGRFDTLLLEHRALLFRGFDADADEFSRFVAATSQGEPLPYVDRTTPRETRGDRIYTSTVHPPSERIELHNEGTYWRRWAAKLYLCCLVAPAVGGQTPIADVRNVYRRIDNSIRRRFAERGFMLVRNYNDGPGLRWQDVFQTDSPEDVEAHCREADIQFEWKSEGRLQTRSIRPAIRRHPTSGEPVWFNHAAFFHPSSLPPDLREALLEQLGPEGLPFETRYGDGSPIEDDVAAELRAAYSAERRMFDWQRGDILVLDNMSVAHAREPYEGPREIVVAMTDPVDEVTTTWEES